MCVRGPALPLLSSPLLSLLLSLPSPPPLPVLSHFPLEVGPLKPARGLGSSAVSSPVENEFSALYSCQKATGGNHFEYYEVHVL